MYVVVGAIYILINYALSKLAEYVQRDSPGTQDQGLPPVTS